ncbi:hypothetical protein C8J56DRAFT_886066 [Mycena floridula]|nr:hypothetical protein C8J56DRAFT_886066 [Mycena floridula]
MQISAAKSGNACAQDSFACADGSGCCPTGDVCMIFADGMPGCCPEGEICDNASDTDEAICADANQVPCDVGNFCCNRGDICLTADHGPTCVPSFMFLMGFNGDSKLSSQNSTDPVQNYAYGGGALYLLASTGLCLQFFKQFLTNYYITVAQS